MRSGRGQSSKPMQFPKLGMDITRAPIVDTVSWGGPLESDDGVSLRGRRRSGETLHNARRNSFQNRKRRGQGTWGIFPDEEGGRFPDRSHVSGDSFNSSLEELNPRRVKD